MALPNQLNDPIQSQPADIATYLQIGQALPIAYDWTTSTPYLWSAMSGSRQIYRLNESGWPYQLSSFNTGYDFFVLSHGGNKAIVGASIGGSEQSQLFLMDCQSGALTQLTNFKDVRFGSVLWTNDDRSIIYRSNQETGKDYFLYRFDIAERTETKIFGDTTLIRGNNYAASLSQDGRKLLLYHLTSNVNNDLYLVDLTDLTYQLVTDPDPGRDVVYKSPRLMPDNRTIMLLTDYNDEAVIRLAKLRIDTKSIKFISGSWLDEGWNIKDFNISRDYRLMAIFVNENGYTKMQIREIESQRELPGPPDLDGILQDAYFGADSTLLFTFKEPTRAPDVWSWQPYTKELKQLTFSTYAGLDREKFSKPKLISFLSFDSLEIPAFLYLPPERKPNQSIPFVIHAHGGPESQFTPGFLRNIQYLIAQGYGILAVNPRGSSGYGTEYLNLDNYQRRKDVLKDYKASVDYLIENGLTAPGMIGIRGTSYGGYVALAMITEYPDLFAAAISTAGIANFETYLTNTKAYRRAMREAEYGPLSDPEFLKSISPIWKADLVKTPLLVIHGANDSRVPVSEARQIIEAISQNGGLVDSLIFADEGHSIGKRRNIITEYRAQVNFFDRYLKLQVKLLQTTTTNQTDQSDLD